MRIRDLVIKGVVQGHACSFQEPLGPRERQPCTSVRPEFYSALDAAKQSLSPRAS